MKTSEEFEKEFLADCKEKTGKTLEEWMAYLEPKGLTKPKETLDYLKSEEGINHMNANFISGIFLNGGKPVFDSALLFNAHFEKFPDKKEMYDKLEGIVKDNFSGVQVVPTKGYISFRNDKEFAVAKINKGNIRIGMDLGSRDFDDYVQKAKSLGTMPRIAYMIEVTAIEQINDDILPFLQEANSHVNG